MHTGTNECEMLRYKQRREMQSRIKGVTVSHLNDTNSEKRQKGGFQKNVYRGYGETIDFRGVRRIQASFVLPKNQEVNKDE